MAKQKYLELTPEELERVAQRKKRDDVAKVPMEWRLLAEFGYYYGWQAVKDVRSNEIDVDTFNVMLAGARKIWANKIIDLSTAIYTSNVASNSKTPQTVMNKGLKDFMKEVRS